MSEQNRPWYRRWLSALSGRQEPAALLSAPRQRTHKRRYEAAQGGRLNAGWISDASGPNAEIAGGIVALRNRSRDLVRNNPIASRAIKVLVNALVADGIRPQPQSGNPDIDALALRLWSTVGTAIDANGRHDVYGLQRLQVHSWLESGEVLARRRWRRPEDGLDVPVQIQLLESDFIADTYETLATTSGRTIQYGIELDAIGKRTAYRLYRSHPGETNIFAGGNGLETVMVPASEVSHVYHVTRPGQLRGVPWMAPVMLELRDLDDLEYTEMTRQKLQACVMGVRKSNNLDPVGNLNGDVEQDEDGDWDETMRPGTIIRLPDGEEVQWLAPQQFGGFAEFAMKYQRGIAMGVNIPYEILTQDLTGTSYASIRAGILEYKRMCSALTHDVVLPHICAPMWRWFIEGCELGGLLPAMSPQTRMALMSPQWHLPQWIQIDRESEIKADILEVQAGVTTHAAICASRGRDYMQVFEQLSREKEQAQELDLSLVGFGQTSPSQAVTMPDSTVDVEDSPEAGVVAEDDATDAADAAA